MTRRFRIAVTESNIAVAVLSATLLLGACAPQAQITLSSSQPKPSVRCGSDWYQQVESILSRRNAAVTDQDGHGPDIGSLEWRSAVEFKLGIRGGANNPPLASTQWCLFIDQQLSGGDQD